MSLTTTIVAWIRASQVQALDLGSPSFDLNKRDQIDLASGTAANKADQLFTDQRTLAASGSESLDLAGGLTDAFGNTLTFARIKAILIRALPANTNNVVIGGAASNAFLGPFVDATDKLSIPPGGEVLLVAPGATAWPVTADTGDLLKIANSSSGTSVTYDIVLVGASA